MTAVLSQVASAIALDPAAASSLSGGSDAARTLFDLIEQSTITVDTLKELGNLALGFLGEGDGSGGGC